MRRKVVPIRRVDGAAGELTDEGLVAAIALGDNAALGALYDRHAAGIRRFLARLSGTDDRDLDDLVQITFERTPAAARKWKRQSTARSWLFGIALNVARRHVRSEVRRKRALTNYAAQPRQERQEPHEDRARSAALHAAILALPRKLRETFVLVYLEGLPGADAARLLGVREGTVWKRLHMARARLRDVLGEIR